MVTMDEFDDAGDVLLTDITGAANSLAHIAQCVLAACQRIISKPTAEADVVAAETTAEIWERSSRTIIVESF